MNRIRLRIKIGRAILLCLVSLTVVSCGTSIHDAAARGDIDALNSMLAKDPPRVNEPDRLGKSPLHFAINFAQQESMRVLLDAGADPTYSDETGLTPLHVASIIDLPGAAKVLVRAGVPINATDDFGDTPLHSAAMHGSVRVLAYLLSGGSDCGMRNREGKTPLDLALRHGQSEAAGLLQDCGGEPE